MVLGMDPDLWAKLPTELLQLVFSHLPVVGVRQLRLLSKTWKRAVDSIDSEFHRLLEKTMYPYMFGVVALKSEGEFSGMVVDVKKRQTHALEINASENYVTTMGAADGGLVCFVSRGGMHPCFIIVMNPLTGKKIELPGLLSMGVVVRNFMPWMVQLHMDRQTWQYKVLVVGCIEVSAGEKRLFAQVYDSKLKAWKVVGSEQRQQSWDRIFGYSYRNWIDRDRRLYNLVLLGPCMYDVAGAGLYHFGKNTTGLYGPYTPYPAPSNGLPLVVPFDLRDNLTYAVLKNHLFVLRSHCDTSSDTHYYSDYYISEFVLEKDATTWVEVGTISNLPFDDSSDKSGRSSQNYYNFFLDACGGFLLLNLDYKVGCTEYKLGYVYDLSKCYWLELPPAQPRPANHRDYGPLDLMCELRWNATP